MSTSPELDKKLALTRKLPAAHRAKILSANQQPELNIELTICYF